MKKDKIIKVNLIEVEDEEGAKKNSRTYLEDKEENHNGWICPICGRGISPYEKYCECCE